MLSAKTISKGVEYNKYTSESKQIVHVLTVNPKDVILKSVHANDKVHGLETVSSLARQENAIAAINGSFFRMGEKVDGLPAGILKIDGRWFGVAYGARGALGWSSIDANMTEKTINNAIESSLNNNIANSTPSNTPSNLNKTDTNDSKISQPTEKNNQESNQGNNSGIKILMDRVQTKTVFELNGSKFPINGVNQPAASNKGILYSDAYGKKIDFVEGSTHIVVENNEIKAIATTGNNITVPQNGFVYALGPEARRPNVPLFVGAKAKVQVKVNPVFKKQDIEDWQTIDNIVGGIPLLIESGRVLQDYGQERIKTGFSHQQHARTAIGILPSNEWIFVVVEKSQATGSPGMTLPELSSFLQSLGCYMALNLDGGGSSTLYLQGKVVNNPENELDETFVLPISRPIADAILVLPREN